MTFRKFTTCIMVIVSITLLSYGDDITNDLLSEGEVCSQNIRENTSLDIWGIDTLFTDSLLHNDLLRGVDLEEYDMDGDGDLDILATSTAGYLRILENQGNYNFIQHSIDVDGSICHISIGELNGDSLPDIAVAYYQDSSSLKRFNWLKNSGNFEFENILIDSTYDCWYPHIVDLDNDNDNDILMSTAAMEERVVLIAINDGAGNFTVDTSASLKTNCTRISAEDMDGDLDIDIVVGNTGWGGVTIFENNGSEVFTPLYVDNDDMGYTNMTLQDLNGDSLKDIAACSYGGHVSYYLNLGNNKFTKKTVFKNDTLSFWDIKAEDINNDGYMDFVTTSYRDNGDKWGGVFSFINDGNLNFNPLIVDSTVDLRGMSLGKLQSGRAPDICAVSWQDGGIYIYKNSIEVPISIMNPKKDDKFLSKDCSIHFSDKEVTISFTKDVKGEVTVCLYNARGSIVKELHKGQLHRSRTLVIDEKEFQSIGKGVYFINIVTDSGIATGKKLITP